MNIAITKYTAGSDAAYVHAECGRRAACVGIYDNGAVNVVCCNAAHRVWRGGGRQFDTLADAVAGYKSAGMRSIIQAAADYTAERDPTIRPADTRNADDTPTPHDGALLDALEDSVATDATSAVNYPAPYVSDVFAALAGVADVSDSVEVAAGTHDVSGTTHAGQNFHLRVTIRAGGDA